MEYNSSSMTLGNCHACETLHESSLLQTTMSNHPPAALSNQWQKSFLRKKTRAESEYSNTPRSQINPNIPLILAIDRVVEKR